MGRLIRRDGTGSVGTIQRSNEADTEELRSGVVVASGNAGRLVTTGGGRTAPQRLKTISQQEAKRQKQIQQARVDLLLPCHHSCPISPDYIAKNLEDAKALRAGQLPGEKHPAMPCSTYQGRWTTFYYAE